MLHHFPTQCETGPCVAYLRGNGEAVIVCECLTDHRATWEAARLNALQTPGAPRFAPHYGRRVSARYFPDEE